MANREVLALNESTPQIEAAQAGDEYLFPRDANFDGTIYIKEGAAANGDTAAYGQLWVKTATPNVMYFTDDAGTDFQIATLTGTETFTNKTLTTPIIATTGSITDAGGDEYVVFTEATTPVTYIGITSGDTGVAPRVSGAGEANTDLHLLGSGTGNVVVSDGTDPTKDLYFELSGATTAKTMNFTSSHTDDRTLTFPDATDTLVGKATTDTMTNKTLTAPVITGLTTGSITAGITANAGGGGVGSAVALTSDINEIATCATGGDSVSLPTAVPGQVVRIINNGAAACDVFPFTSDDCGGGVDTAVSLGIGANITYICYTVALWVAAS